MSVQLTTACTLNNVVFNLFFLYLLGLNKAVLNDVTELNNNELPQNSKHVET